MDGNWRPTQGSDPAAAAIVDPNAPAPAGGDWRAQLQPEARTRIVNKITCRMETLKKHLPVSVPEGLNELQKIAVRFEEKIYTAATCQSDYLWKISLKIFSMETKTQQAPGNAQVIPNQNNPGPDDGMDKCLNELCEMLKTVKVDIKKNTSSHVITVHKTANFKKSGKRKIKTRDEISKWFKGGPNAETVYLKKKAGSQISTTGVAKE